MKARSLNLVATIAAIVLLSACAAKVAPVTTPTPPAPRAAIVESDSTAPRAILVPAILSPTTITFTQSPDHDAVDLAGVAILSRYDVKVVPEATPTAAGIVFSIGKPTYDGAGIVVHPPELLTLPKDLRQILYVLSVGPGGTNASGASDPFGIPGPSRAPAAVSTKPGVK